MAITEALDVVDRASRIQRILALDDLWTGALQRPISNDEALALVPVGREMADLLVRLRDDSGYFLRLIDENEEAFEYYCDAAMAAAEAASGGQFRVGPILREAFGSRPWTYQLRRAFGAVLASQEEAALHGTKIELLNASEVPAPDFRLPFRCMLEVALLGADIALLVVETPIGIAIPPAYIAHAGIAAGHVGLTVANCRDEFRRGE